MYDKNYQVRTSEEVVGLLRRFNDVVLEAFNLRREEAELCAAVFNIGLAIASNGRAFFYPGRDVAFKRVIEALKKDEELWGKMGQYLIVWEDKGEKQGASE